MKRSLLALVALLIGWPGGCSEKTIRSKPAPPPPPTYTGPAFFRSTIGSLVTVRGYKPALVSGFGLVVGLRGTGSPDCPPQLRQWFISEMSRGGFGKESLGFGRLSPQQVLNSYDTAVVVVEGMIPPGAPAGTYFDVLVKALPGTQTSSLEGGRLYTANLSLFGAIPDKPSSRTLAKAHGPIFTNPFARLKSPGQRTDDPRLGRILAGAVVTEDMPLILALNSPSYPASRRITDRINGRFPPSVNDRGPMAVAANPQNIRLNILARYRDNPRRMIAQILHLYLNPTDTFARQMAGQLAEALARPENEQYRHRVSLAWQGMGRMILPQLRKWYAHDNPTVQLAALEAGAYLGDTSAADPLEKIARSGAPGHRELATGLIGRILLAHPDNYRLARILRNLLDNDDALVRMAACRGLAAVGDAAVNFRRFPENPKRPLKLELWVVRSDKPMIFVNREKIPRIIIFDQMLGFRKNLFFTTWDDRLMIKTDPTAKRLQVYYRPYGQVNSQTEPIAPAVANLVYLLAYQPTEDQPGPGFNLSYSQIVEVLARLNRTGDIAAPLVLQDSDLDRIIDESRREQQASEARPESQEKNKNPNTDVENRPQTRHNSSR